MAKCLFYILCLTFACEAGSQDSAAYWWRKTDSAYRIPDFVLGQQYEQKYRDLDKYPHGKLFAFANSAVGRNYEKLEALIFAKMTEQAISVGNWLIEVLRQIDTSRYQVKYWVMINEKMMQLYYSQGRPDSANRYRANIYQLVQGDLLPMEVDEDFRFIDGLYEHKKVKAKEWLFRPTRSSRNNYCVKQQYAVADSAGNSQYVLSLIYLPSYNKDLPFEYVLTRLNFEGLGYRDRQEGLLLTYTYQEPLDYSLIDKDIRSILRGEYRETEVHVTDTSRLKQMIREELDKMSQALVALDMDVFVPYLHPVLRGRFPEYKKAVAHYRDLYTSDSRFRFTKASAGEPGKLVQVNGELQTVIPWTVYFTAGGKKYKEIRTISAHSLNGGKTWYFYEPFNRTGDGERKRAGVAIDDGQPFISHELKITKTIQTELQ